MINVMTKRQYLWCAAAFLLLGMRAPAVPIAWSSFGTAATGSWFVATNWTPAQVPQAGDDVTITNAAATVFLTGVSANVSSLALGRSLIFSNWNACLRATTVTVTNGGVMTCAGPFTNNSMSNRVYVLCTDFNLLSGGWINVDFKGYRGGDPAGSYSGQGPGGPVWPGGNNGHAASYGGFGIGSAAVWPYGASNAPVFPGSGSTVSWWVSYYAGGNGGGAVWIDASGLVTINGVISANGQHTIGVNGGSGGSGGGIFISCQALAGTSGVVWAKGNVTNSFYGGGGGGRIAVIYDPVTQRALPTPQVVFSVAGGGGGGGAGDIGTLFFPDNQFLTATSGKYFWGQWYSTDPVIALDRIAWSNCWLRFPMDGTRIIVTNDLILDTSATLEVGGNRYNNQFRSSAPLARRLFGHYTNNPLVSVGGDLIVRGSSNLRVFGGQTNAVQTDAGSISVTGAIQLLSGTLGLNSNPTNAGAVVLRATDLSVASGGTITSKEGGFSGGFSDYGHAAGWGPGGPAATRAGGGYGGRGGTSAGQLGGLTYGSANVPDLPGSGGSDGAWVSNFGASGGGVIRVHLRNNVAVSGAFNSDGRDYMGWGDGGGSGGGIYITCRNYGCTNGSFTAKGGAGNNATTLAGGGGGRIAIWRAYGTNAGVFSVQPGTNGGVGTVVFGWVADIALSPTNLSCILPLNATTNLTFEVWNPAFSNATLNYAITTNVSWLTVSSTSGSSTGEHDTITVACNSTGVGSGILTGRITVVAVDPYSDGQIYRTVQVVMSVLPGLNVSPT
ncbi:MAG: hypothetical protein HY343_05535, partial [Lentisphaerae bacterium]|nr:hypothetical protein [Lentisphaerota bacterium]